jgi:hypothetical protein
MVHGAVALGLEFVFTAEGIENAFEAPFVREIIDVQIKRIRAVDDVLGLEID